MGSAIIDRSTGLTSSAAIKGPCRAASTANITLSGLQTIDGVALAVNNRVLVTGQTVGADNGIYVAAVGVWERAADFSSNDDVRKGTLIHVTDGAVTNNIWQVTTNDRIEIGVTSIAFEASTILTNVTRPYVTVGFADADYICDGTADDVQIQAAIDAVGAGGGTVHIKGSATAYDIRATVTFNSRTIIEGEGIATQLKAKTNLNAAVLKSNGRVSQAWVRDLYINGNSANQSASGIGIEQDGFYNWYQDLWVLDCKTTGLKANNTASSSEIRIKGGRYNALVNAIDIDSSSSDFIMEDVVAYGGVATVLIAPSGGMINDCVIFGGSSFGIHATKACNIRNPRISSTPIGIYIDGSANNIVSPWNGMNIVNPVFSDISNIAISQNIGATFNGQLSVVGWEGANATNSDVYFDGLGTHKPKIKSAYPTLKAFFSGTGSMHSTSVIEQPLETMATAPAAPVLGMVYLDSGANTENFKPGLRRYNGSAWVDVDYMGYGTGAGGSVTQATDKSTGVTLDKTTGRITMNNATLAAGTIVSFTLTDSKIAATDVLVLNHLSGGTLGSYTLNARCGAGSAVIDVRNNTAGDLSEALVLAFVLIKGATS